MAQPETTELLLREDSKSAQFQEEEERGTGSDQVETYLYTRLSSFMNGAHFRFFHNTATSLLYETNTLTSLVHAVI